MLSKNIRSLASSTTLKRAFRDSSQTYQVVMMRHGHSLWNAENRFTGWVDVPLAPEGIEEAKLAGQRLQERGLTFDVGFTSVLRRSINTLDTVLTELGQTYIPVNKLWRLNERYYGSLTGLNKKELMEKVGEEQVMIWRRSADIAPPPIDITSEYHPINDPRYSQIPPSALPATEVSIPPPYYHRSQKISL